MKQFEEELSVLNTIKTSIKHFLVSKLVLCTNFAILHILIKQLSFSLGSKILYECIERFIHKFQNKCLVA